MLVLKVNFVFIAQSSDFPIVFHSFPDWFLKTKIHAFFFFFFWYFKILRMAVTGITSNSFCHSNVLLQICSLNPGLYLLLPDTRVWSGWMIFFSFSHSLALCSEHSSSLCLYLHTVLSYSLQCTIPQCNPDSYSSGFQHSDSNRPIRSRLPIDLNFISKQKY